MKKPFLSYHAVAVCVLCLFLMVPWVDLKSVGVTFPGHTNILLDTSIVITISINRETMLFIGSFFFFFFFCFFFFFFYRAA